MLKVALFFTYPFFFFFCSEWKNLCKGSFFFSSISITILNMKSRVYLLIVYPLGLGKKGHKVKYL